MAEKHEGTERSDSGGNGNAGDSTGYGLAQATEAMEKLRAVVDQASQSFKDLTQIGQQWAQSAPARAQEMAQEMREQGGRAMGTMAETVEQSPLISVAVAFAAGFLLASLIKR